MMFIEIFLVVLMDLLVTEPVLLEWKLELLLARLAGC